MNQWMTHSNRGPGGGERGSALILAILIMVIMTLLGIPRPVEPGLDDADTRLGNVQRLGVVSLVDGDLVLGIGQQ